MQNDFGQEIHAEPYFVKIPLVEYEAEKKELINLREQVKELEAQKDNSHGCAICMATKLAICFVSEKGMHYGYSGGYSGDVSHYAIKVKTDVRERGKYIRFKHCPSCGRKLNFKR